MNRRWLLLVLPVVAAAGVGYRTMQAREVKVAVVTRGTSVSAVYANGAVEPVDRVDVAARVSGPVAELKLREGDSVEKGDLLVRIDAPTLGHDVTRAKAESTAAAARLGIGPAIESLRAQRKGLAAQLAQADADLARVMSLHKSGSAGAAELDRVRAQVDSLRAQIAANEAQERDLSIALQADAQRQRALLDSARSRLDDTEVRSPLKGTVMRRRVELGQVVSAGQVVMRVGDLSRLHLEVDVDEADVAEVRVGQAAAIRLYALRGQVISGHVSKIHPEADRDRKAFRVEVEFDQRPEGLYPGMTAEVNIVLARHDNVLMAPLEAVRDGHVWVVEDGRAKRRAVSVKQKDLVYAEIEGLAEGASVVVGDDSKLEDGARVRAVPAALAPVPGSTSSGALSSAQKP